MNNSMRRCELNKHTNKIEQASTSATIVSPTIRVQSSGDNNLTSMPSTSSLNNSSSHCEEIDDLHITFEDFCDSPEDDYNSTIIQPETVSFTTGHGQLLSCPPPKNVTPNNTGHTLFTKKPPVKVPFAPPKKKMKIQETATSANAEIIDNNNIARNTHYSEPIKSAVSASTEIDNNNIANNNHHTEPNVLYQNCTFNGIVNNYYYYYQNSDVSRES